MTDTTQTRPAIESMIARRAAAAEIDRIDSMIASLTRIGDRIESKAPYPAGRIIGDAIARLDDRGDDDTAGSIRRSVTAMTRPIDHAQETRHHDLAMALAATAISHAIRSLHVAVDVA